MLDGQADPVLLACRIRGHRRVENQLSWVRDVTFDEDRSTVRAAAGPQVMAALRNLARTALRLAGSSNIAAGLDRHARERLLSPAPSPTVSSATRYLIRRGLPARF